MIKSTLKKLLRYPHSAVFDKDPVVVAAMRLNSSSGLTWRITDEIMSVSIGGTERTYDLADFTVGTLIQRLTDDGAVVQLPSAQLFGRSARVLMDGKGDSSKAGEDAILGFTSPLWITYAAYASELRQAKKQVNEALKQMVITQAEDEWLDLWGSLYDVPRLDGETDADYQVRIPEEAFRLRVNKYAIEKAILDLTGNRIHLRETWSRMFRLDESRMSGTHRLVNGDAWRYGYIQPYAKELFDWGNALEVIERNKAAGVIVFDPIAEIDRHVDAEMAGIISFGVLATAGAWVRPSSDFKLDFLRLDTTTAHRNWTAACFTTAVLMSTVDAGSEALNGLTVFAHVTTTEWTNRRTWNGGSWRTWAG